MSAEAPQTAQTLFDSNVSQMVRFTVERNNKRYPVGHQFKPLSDEEFLKLDTGRDVRMTAVEDEAASGSGLAMTTKGFEASVAYWNRNAVGCENYGSKGPNDFDKVSEKISPDDRVQAVDFLLAAEIEPVPVASDDEACPLEFDENSVVTLRALFNGEQLYLAHTLRPISNSLMSEYRHIMAHSFVVQGAKIGNSEQRIPSRAKRLGALYDKIVVSTSGYASDIVPLHHKVKVVLDQFAIGSEIISKN